jgi:hypothetical protein
MPMFKIFVGNLDPKVTVEMLRPMFEPFGELDEVVVARDEDGKSRGFAIVLYKDAMKGQLAIETLTGRKILGREIVINEAMKKGKKKMGPADASKPRGPFGPKFRGAGGAGGGNWTGGRSGGPRSGSSRGPAAGGRPAAGGDRPAGGGFSRNPRRGFGGGSRPAGPGGPGSPSRPPPPGPGGRGPGPGPSRPRPDED